MLTFLVPREITRQCDNGREGLLNDEEPFSLLIYNRPNRGLKWSARCGTFGTQLVGEVPRHAEDSCQCRLVLPRAL